MSDFAPEVPLSGTAVDLRPRHTDGPVLLDSSLGVITQALYQRRLQALTVARIVRKTVAPGVRRAVSTTVRIAASPSAAHVAR